MPKEWLEQTSQTWEQTANLALEQAAVKNASMAAAWPNGATRPIGRATLSGRPS